MKRLAPLGLLLAGLACGTAERAPEPAAGKPEPRAGGAGGNASDPGIPAADPPPPGDPAVAGLPEVVAEIDGEKITRDRFLRNAVEWWGRETMEEIVLRHVLAKAVEKYGVSVTDEEMEARVEAEIKARDAETRQKFQLTLPKYLAQFGRTVDDLRKEFRQNDNLRRQILIEYMIAYAYITEPRVRIAHILVRDQEKADDIRRKLKEGADFAKLAEQESDDGSSATKGGAVPAFIRGMSNMGTSFEDAAFALKEAGDLSPVLKTDLGYHVLKLLERRAASPQTFEALRKEVEKAQMDRKVLDLWMRRLRSDFAKDVKYLAPGLEPKSAGK